MAKDVINVDGKETLVREDTAKAFRFVHWGIITAGICLAILALVFLLFFLKAASNGNLQSPGQIDNSNRR